MLVKQPDPLSDFWYSYCVGHNEACKVRDDRSLKRNGIVMEGSYRQFDELENVPAY